MSVVPEYTPTMYAVAITVEISPPMPHILMKIENMEMNRTWYCRGDFMKKFEHILQYQLDYSNLVFSFNTDCFEIIFD